MKSSAELVESDFDAQATKKPRITRIICEVCQVQLPDWEKYYLHVLTTQHKDMAKTFDAVLKKCATIEIMDMSTTCAKPQKARAGSTEIFETFGSGPLK